MKTELINPMVMTGRRFLVTGASSGIGREVSMLLSRLGARVVTVGRNKERLDVTCRSLTGEGHGSETMDLEQIQRIPEWMKTLASQYGRFDGLVHCAGMQFVRPLRFIKEDEVSELIKINLEASIALAKGFRHKAVRAEHAGIVFISSVVGLVGQSGTAAYSASKGALVSLAKSLALELAQERIRVNCVAPAVVNTEMTARFKAELTEAQFDAIEKMHPLGIGEALDVAYAIAFLLGDTGRWITGTTLVVDGGYSAH